MKICPTCQQTYSDDLEFCPRDGARLTAQATETEAQLAGQLSRRFRIVRRLGAGAMGAVFLAEQIAVGNRPVALKVLNRKLLDDPDFLLRFQNEAASTGRIHHPNVVTIYESGQADDGTPYIAMEFLEGESLRQALARRGALPLPEVAEILQQAARGLNAAHKLGIIHRDLKPDNIFLTRGDEGEMVVKVVDFGIAKLRESGIHTQTGMVLGTPAYMSFEQASGMRSDELDARSDIYSLGVVTYEMLTGRAPFRSDTPVGYLRMHMQEDPPPFRAVKPDLPALPQLESVVMKALAKDRDQRYPSVLDFARELTSAAQPSPRAEAPVALPSTRIVSPPAVAKPPQPRPATESPSKMRFVAIAGIALIVIVAGVLYFWQHKTKKGDVSWSSKAGESRWESRVNPSDGLKYMWILPGSFQMGCSPGDTECGDDEKPPHQVTVTKGFWLGQTEVTVGAYKRFAAATGRHMPDAPGFNSRWANENMPIVNVTWNDAHDYCTWAGGRLPTEAEWEYAARAGSTQSHYDDLDRIAWYISNSSTQSHDVAQKLANGFGLYDMLGNVWEWVKDWYDENYYKNSPAQDPAGPAVGQFRVLRGGSWGYGPRFVRVSVRSGDNPAGGDSNVGFRCGGDVAGQRVAASQSPTAASQQPPKPASQPPDTKAQLAEKHFLKGYALFSTNDLDGAIAEYREAIRLKPDLAAAHYELGLALGDKGDLNAAIAEHREAIRLKPDDPEVHLNLGVALDQKGDLDGAIAEYHEGIRLKPDIPGAHFYLGGALRGKGDLDGAIAEYREGIRLKPNDARDHVILGEALDQKRDSDGAIAEFREAIRLKPDFARAHRDLGVMLREKGDTDSAISEFREAIRLKGDYAEAHCSLGVALEQKGDLQPALEEYRKAYELAPQNPTIRGDYEKLLKRLSPQP